MLLRGTATSGDGRRFHIAFDEAAKKALVFPEPPGALPESIAPFLPNLLEEAVSGAAEARARIEAWLSVRGWTWEWAEAPSAAP
jgi:hypothetical protein